MPRTVGPGIIDFLTLAAEPSAAVRDQGGQQLEPSGAGPAAKPEPKPASTGHHAPEGNLAALSLGALGVVYGDIGTSPLYAIRECFHGKHAIAPTPVHILGVLSLVFWALVLVICVKYLTFIMRCDNRGEGGILSLSALVMGSPRARKVSIPVLLGLFGAGLLLGEGLITPPISILGAVEGLEIATDSLSPVVVPLTGVILIALFSVQRFGTGKIGAVFGWVMLLWFMTLAVTGILGIVHHPSAIRAINPVYAVRFFQDAGIEGFLLLGSVVLVVTGAEALYADMGHFGRRPIRTSWFAIVMPCLLLNYFGQGALLLEGGEAVARNPFYALAPGIWIYPMMVLATMAAIIASQALISGAYSLTRSAVQLGFLPRMRIVHTSGELEGQIYIPEINWMMLAACLALVFAFQTSSALAAAYGIAVTGTMIITSILFLNLATRKWRWNKLATGALVAVFLAIDVSLFSANIHKIADGAWFPLAMAALVFTLMVTWRRGRTSLADRFRNATLPLDLFLTDIQEQKPHRVSGTAVFMTSTAQGIPPVLLHHLKHNKVLHQQVVLLSVVIERQPHVNLFDNVAVDSLGHGLFRVTGRYGFMQDPFVPRLLARCRQRGLDINLDDTTYYLGRETLLVSGESGMSIWRKAIFAFMSRNARSATSFFNLPPNRVCELGAQIEL